MTNWEKCSAVERDPNKLSGAWYFAGHECQYPLYSRISRMVRRWNNSLSGSPASRTGT